jgi:cobalt-zinc-cadmium efflux system membrane fusion protein
MSTLARVGTHRRGFAGFAVLALLGSGAACRRGAAQAEAVPAEDELWIAPDVFGRGEAHAVEVRPQLLSEPIAAGGRIAFDDQRVTHVFSPVTGKVTRVIAQPGQLVKKGAPLAAIASPDVGSAFADEAKGRADLIAAEHDLKRQTALFAEKAASRRDFENAEDNYHKALAEHQRALQRLRLLREGRIDAVTQEYLLPSHIDGRVVSRTVNPGMEVQGQFSGGTAVELFTIGSTEVVWLFADVSEAELPELREGAAVAVRVLAYPDQVFHGKVEWISPTLDPALRTARIRCSLPNPDERLKPEMFASVRIERPAVQRLAVSRDAIVRIGDQSFVYVAAGARPDGRQVFRRRHVQIPNRDGPPKKTTQAGSEVFVPAVNREPEGVPVLAGLAEGEQVLIDAGHPRPRGADDALLSRAQLALGKISTVLAEERDVPDAVTLGGRLTFDDLKVAHVFSPVNGRIVQLLAAPGQRLKKGDPLAHILSPDLGSAFADELKARADLTVAEHELTRQREMYAVRASSQKDFQAAEDNYGRAKAEYDRAEQKTRLLRAGARAGVNQQFVLRSPIDGDVIARAANPGVEVQGAYAGGGNMLELFTVGSIGDLWLISDVYEADLPYVRTGAAVELSVSAWPGRTFHGTVDWVSDTLDPVLRTAKVRCVLGNAEGLLRPEMYGVVRITAPTRHAVTVPRDAVLRLGDETNVFVQGEPDKDGNVPFVRRQVIANEQLPGDAVPVLYGLRAGERVAAAGSIFLVGN